MHRPRLNLSPTALVLVLVLVLPACTRRTVTAGGESVVGVPTVLAAPERARDPGDPGRGQPAAPALAEPAEAALPPTSRPRLSHTVTLGQGTVEPYMPSSPPRAAAAPGVVVNNTIVVQGGAPGYGGYGGYGLGYGGYGGRGYGNVGRVSSTVDGTSGRTGASQVGPWSTTGWEGPGRTAAPGQTPGVGGNWSPPPSYGPKQMK